MKLKQPTIDCLQIHVHRSVHIVQRQTNLFRHLLSQATWASHLACVVPTLQPDHTLTMRTQIDLCAACWILCWPRLKTSNKNHLNRCTKFIIAARITVNQVAKKTHRGPLTCCRVLIGRCWPPQYSAFRNITETHLIQCTAENKKVCACTGKLRTHSQQCIE